MANKPERYYMNGGWIDDNYDMRREGRLARERGSRLSQEQQDARRRQDRKGAIMTFAIWAAMLAITSLIVLLVVAVA